MEDTRPKTLQYKRSHFTTQLPLSYLYSPSHYWLVQQEDNVWKVGLTKFATRMLGDMVDHGFETEIGASVEPGKILGWIEGFKAISDIFCTASGTFEGNNAVLKENITLVNQSCYSAGWLYMIQGTPDPRCVDVHGYRTILDKSIDKIMEKQKDEEIE